MARAWHLKSRPDGMPSMDNFELKELDVPALDDGQIRVRNQWLSVDPYMRGRMNDVKSYVPPFQVGAPLEGGAVGEVVESRSDRFSPGDLVQHMAGWRDEAVIGADQVLKLPNLGAEPQAYLGLLGVTGMTAYFGLLDIAAAKAGDVVFVSAAAGAVGSVVVQIAKSRGMTVIGSAGGPDKCDYVRSLGADAVVDYRAGPVLKGLATAVKQVGAEGVDVYFDNVGGDHLDAALALARLHARFAICGMISVYNDAGPTALRFLARVIAARIQLKGFIVFDFQKRYGEFYQAMGPLVQSGAIAGQDTIVDGLEATPDAFLGLFTGKNTGKMLVKL